MPRPSPLRATCAASALLVAAALTAGSQAVADTGAADVAKLNAQRAAHGIPAGIVEIPDWTRWCDLHIFYIPGDPPLGQS